MFCTHSSYHGKDSRLRDIPASLSHVTFRAGLLWVSEDLSASQCAVLGENLGMALLVPIRAVSTWGQLPLRVNTECHCAAERCSGCLCPGMPVLVAVFDKSFRCGHLKPVITGCGEREIKPVLLERNNCEALLGPLNPLPIQAMLWKSC